MENITFIRKIISWVLEILRIHYDEYCLYKLQICLRGMQFMQAEYLYFTEISQKLLFFHIDIG